MKQFQTVFEEATLFHPYLQELSIILDGESLEAENRRVFMRIEACDANRNPLTNIITPGGILEVLPVTDIIVESPITWGAIYRFCITPAHIIDYRMRWLYVTMRDLDNESLILAEKWVKICKVGLPHNEVLLRWLNSKAGWDAWAFNNLRNDTIRHSNTVDYRQYASRVATIVKREANLELNLKANDVPKKQIEGLATLFQSKQVYVDDTNEYFKEYRTIKQDVFIPCYINETTISIYETAAGVYEVDFILKLTAING